MASNSQRTAVITEITVPVPWGVVRGQHFKASEPGKTPDKQVIALHGHLDNSNSFKPLATLLCLKGYEIFALDSPGQGFSSPVPTGVQYSPKLIVMTVRRVVRHLGLKSYLFMTHSYGALISYMYAATFPDEVEAIIAIDWLLAADRQYYTGASNHWRRGIDDFLDNEQDSIAEQSKADTRKPLTYDYALKLLMEANRHLDEKSARLLLERGLATNANGRLEFTRDINVKKALTYHDHFVEFIQFKPDIVKNMKCPILFLAAWPPSFGEMYYKSTMSVLDSIKSHPKQIKKIKVEGTHHFHMIKPEETCETILKYMDKIQAREAMRLKAKL